MRTVGKRKIRPVTFKASEYLLRQGAIFNDEIHKLPTGNTTYFPKGIYRYRTQVDANNHWEDCVVAGIARNARQTIERQKYNGSHYSGKGVKRVAQSQ